VKNDLSLVDKAKEIAGKHQGVVGKAKELAGKHKGVVGKVKNGAAKGIKKVKEMADARLAQAQDLYRSGYSESEDYYYRPRYHHYRDYDDRSYRDYTGDERSESSGGERGYYHDDDHNVYVGSERSYSEEPQHNQEYSAGDRTDSFDAVSADDSLSDHESASSIVKQEKAAAIAPEIPVAAPVQTSVTVVTPNNKKK